MAPPESRPMSYSVGTITTFVMPHMQNVLGDLFGGNLMALVDQAAAVAAIRHAGGPAVTASIDRVDFRERIPVGSLVTCEATVDFVGNTSMDITVEVYAETGEHGRAPAHPHGSRGLRGDRRAREADAGAAPRAGDRRGAGALCASGGAPAEQAVDVIPRGVTVVLSGGGAKTAAHLGAMRALAEHGLAPARYVATSMGAVIAAGLAAGVAASVLLERLTLVGRRGIVRDPVAPVLGLFARSLLRPAPFRRAVEALVPARRFGELAGAAHGLRRRPRHRRAVAARRGRLRRAAGGRAVRHLRAAAVLPARARWSAAAAATADSGACCRSSRRRGWPWSPWSRWTLAPGSTCTPGAASAMPPAVRAHDEAVGILMAAHTAAQLAPGARARRVRRWPTSGPGSSGTRPSRSSGCGNTRRTAIPEALAARRT